MMQWLNLRDRLRDDYGDSMVLLTSKMKRELGFTPRSYTGFDGVYYYTDMRLDFWDDQLQTMFILRYGSYITDNDSSL